MKKLLVYIFVGLFFALSMSSCQGEGAKDDDTYNPLIGYWMQTSSLSYGDMFYPNEEDASFVSFTKTQMTKYSSYSDKYEETSSLGYVVKDNVLWYDTGSRTFTNDETIICVGLTLKITQKNGNYDEYTKIQSLPF